MSKRKPSNHRQGFSIQLILCALSLIIIPGAAAHAQSGIDMVGTGGRHIINGRIFFPSGRRADASIKVRLESTNSGALSVLADTNGSFSFRSLEAGNYTLTIDAGEEYEIVRENVYIDPERRDPSLRVVGTSRTFTLPIYLQLKRNPGDKQQTGVLNAALASVPRAAADLYRSALASAQAGDSKKAVGQLRAALSVHPEFALALNELGVQYLKLGQADKAAESLQSAVRLSPDAFTPRLNYGIALLQKKQFDDAATHLRQALQKNDSSPSGHYYLGLALMKQRSFDDAEKELLRSITLGGDSMGMAHYYLGGIYWGERDYKKAADALEKYVKLFPKAANAEKIRTTIKELRSKS